jgi:pimeloyl-ACP methyl ester carboxylesterase
MATFILVPGMWIGAWAWRDVTRGLRDAGHEVYPLTLTGVADRSHLAAGVDLETHIADVVRLVEAEDLHDVVLVAHSYAGLPVSAAALRVRDRVAKVVYVESGPLPEGTTQLSMAGDEQRAAITGDLVPPRAWDPQADPVTLAGLDADALALLRARSTPHPLGSVDAPLGARATAADVPSALVACVFDLEQVRAMTAARHPFFSGLQGAEVVSLPTGHWPMLSEPKALTDVLHSLAA